MFALLAAALALVPSAFAQQVQSSPALAQLQQEASKDGAAATAATPEDAKNAASQGFTGETATGKTVQSPLPPGKDPNGQAYVMVGQQAVKGINIYTPKWDPTGSAVTAKPKAADLVSKKKVLGAAALGAAALVGGLMTGGFLGAALLVAGGAFLGIAAVLGFLRHKLNKGKA